MTVKRRPPGSKASPAGRNAQTPRPDAKQALRAMADLGRGEAVLIEGPDGRAFLMAAAERLDSQAASLMSEAGRGEAELWLTRTRAATVKLRNYTGAIVALPFRAPFDTGLIRRLADPSRDLARPLAGPFQTRRDPLGAGAGAVIALLKAAELLPAALVVHLNNAPARTLARSAGLLRLRSEDIGAFSSHESTRIELVTEAHVPLEGAEDTQILAFREIAPGTEHLALIIGAPRPKPKSKTPAWQPPLVRLHSACLTGDLLGSLKCDCGPQLKSAIARMAKEPSGGVLLYLAQEGRGIGLLNKLRAYRLQDQGFDTVDANLRLGFEADERSFAVAAEMLKWLGLTHIRLLTNNPDKVDALRPLGITVVERVAHRMPDNPHNAQYLKTKARRAGHLL